MDCELSRQTNVLLLLVAITLANVGVIPVVERLTKEESRHPVVGFIAVT